MNKIEDIWRPISDNYEASYDGHIRNSKTKRILREFVGNDGYLRTQFDGKTRTIHRTIAQAYIPIDPDRKFINHKDGNKQNNSVDNLEWCTRSENMRHAYFMKLKTPPVGSKNGRSRLSESDVNFIRDHYVKGDPIYGGKALAERFGVAHQTICAVVSGQNWKEVK